MKASGDETLESLLGHNARFNRSFLKETPGSKQNQGMDGAAINRAASLVLSGGCGPAVVAQVLTIIGNAGWLQHRQARPVAILASGRRRTSRPHYNQPIDQSLSPALMAA
jgi:hypothetical protein